MNSLRPQTLLTVLLVAVLLAVLSAGVISFLLLRDGYGLFIGAVLPFLASLTIVVALGVFLGRAAGGRGGAGGARRDEPGGEKPRRRNDV
ncbi:MAG TPA: hypothetical protein VFE21_10490 [Rubrobacteraceae bacterium]|nr:hypothetical protein [Rubrobacteraceae bacterium]